MANKKLFQPKTNTDTINEAGGKAYQLPKKHQLAQYAATGCLNDTFYISSEDQLGTVIELCKDIDAKFIAQVAIYCRESGYMKDMPALLLAILSTKDKEIFKQTFPRVIDNGKMLRNFVQIMRSGAVGRSSLGTLPKTLVQNWLNSHKSETIFEYSVGNDPSIADIIKMVHPKPETKEQEALYGYLIGKEHNEDNLPKIVRQFELFKYQECDEIPKIPWEMLTAMRLSGENWIEIAKNAKWHMTRMNLNTFARHGVFEDQEMVNIIAARLRDPEAIKKIKVFPYQLMAAYLNIGNDIPSEIREALQDALEIATENVPEIVGKVYIFPDVSGSMSSPITGHRQGSTSKVRCIDVAALISASILRKNSKAEIIPFERDVCQIQINPRDSVMTNAHKLSRIGGGGTNCSAPLRLLNSKKASGDLLIYISDNESWIDGNYRNTGTKEEWVHFKSRNPKAKLICIDIQPNSTTQAPDDKSILNVGGFSDNVFSIIEEFATGRLGSDHWTNIIEKVEI